MNYLKLLTPVLLFVCCSAVLTAASDNKSGANVSLTASTLPELQTSADYTFFLPANTYVKIKGALSPVSVKADGEAVWTPLPFLQFVGSGSAGTG
ncbi:MAG TPA: hypothetical protein P5123_09065, partial [Spirochaetota bacterium]|nr:hypothetical protein [Spirochaetota bacterium]